MGKMKLYRMQHRVRVSEMVFAGDQRCIVDILNGKKELNDEFDGSKK